MTDTDTPTWHTASRSAREAALEAYLDGHARPSDLEQAADEYAEWTSDHIYYYRARAIFNDSSDVQNLEEYIDLGEEASIDQRIQACVYSALRQEFMETIDALLDENDDDDITQETPEQRQARHQARIDHGNYYMEIGLYAPTSQEAPR
jgi:hypothetical protein